MASKLTPELERELLVKATEGLSTREISSWLHTEHGIRLSNVAVANRLRATRTERADVAKVVVREVLSKSVLSDVAVLKQQQLRTRKLATRLLRKAMGRDDDGPLPPDVDHGAAELYLKCVDRISKLTDLTLKYSGAGDTDGTQAAGVHVLLPAEDDDDEGADGDVDAPEGAPSN